MCKRAIDAEVAYAKPESQTVIKVTLDQGTTIQQAIIKSGIVKQYPEIDLSQINVGIFGLKCTLDKIVEQTDRVEIYRPLLQHPMDARRNRIKNSR